MSYEIISLVTNVAKTNCISALIHGYGIEITHIAIGNQGHVVSSPSSAKTPDPGLNPAPGLSGDSIPSDVTFGPFVVGGWKIGVNSNGIFTFTLNKGEGTGEISSYYLLAKFIYPVTHVNYDKLFVFSCAYTPLKVKTDNELWENMGIGIQF